MKKQNEMKLPECYVDMNDQEVVSASGGGPEDIINNDDVKLMNSQPFDLDDADLERLELEVKQELGPALKTKASNMDKVLGLNMAMQAGSGLITGMTQFIKSATKKY